MSRREFGPTSEDEARRVGFGRAVAAAEPPVIISFDPNYDANMERCAKEVDGRLSAEDRQVYYAYMDLVASMSYRGEVYAELPSDLPLRSFECMERKGYHADREEFLKTPNPDLYGVPRGSYEDAPEKDWRPQEKPGTVQVGPEIPQRKYTPTPEESVLAVAWFQCGQETGRVDAYMATCFKIQQRYVDKYADRIAELNPRLQALARMVAAWV